MSDKNKETELLRASLMQQVSELNDDEIISLYDELEVIMDTILERKLMWESSPQPRFDNHYNKTFKTKER